MTNLNSEIKVVKISKDTTEITYKEDCRYVTKFIFKLNGKMHIQWLLMLSMMNEECIICKTKKEAIKLASEILIESNYNN